MLGRVRDEHSLLAPNHYTTCHSHTKLAIWIRLLIRKLVSAQLSMSPPPVSGASHASRTCNDAPYLDKILTKSYIPRYLYNLFLSILFHLFLLTELTVTIWQNTCVHSNTKGQLTSWVWVNPAVTVQEVGKWRKHVMTNKQHTKFHISYIKYHACRHKSMAASYLT